MTLYICSVSVKKNPTKNHLDRLYFMGQQLIKNYVPKNVLVFKYHFVTNNELILSASSAYFKICRRQEYIQQFLDSFEKTWKKKTQRLHCLCLETETKIKSTLFLDSTPSHSGFWLRICLQSQRQLRPTHFFKRIPAVA